MKFNALLYCLAVFLLVVMIVAGWKMSEAIVEKALSDILPGMNSEAS